VLEHGDVPGVQWRRKEDKQERVEGPNVDAYASEEDDSHEDILLLTIGEESYRPSPASPGPVPESEEEDDSRLRHMSSARRRRRLSRPSTT
jgi:hypothetical protein